MDEIRYSSGQVIKLLTGARSIDKEDYLLAMERSPIKDIEIKHLLKATLTDEIDSREVYMSRIDYGYYYEDYTTFKAEDL